MKKWMVSKLVGLYKYIGKAVLEAEYNKLRSKYEIHPSFKFNGAGINFYGAGRLIIGENSYIGELSKIQLEKGCSITIGRGCHISHNVRMYSSSAIGDWDFSIKPVKSKKGDISIGNYVWIGANVFINPGISIGENAIVGANSVVTKDVAPFSIVGGVPAKLIRYKNVTI